MLESLVNITVLDNTAFCFAKHGKEFCKKFYIQFFSDREAAKLLWKCYTSFTNLIEPEQEAVKLREKLLGKRPISTLRKISKWYNNEMNLIELAKNIDVTDKGLKHRINRVSGERVCNDVISASEDEDKKKDIDEPQTSTNLVELSNTEVTKWKNVVPHIKVSSEETVLKKI